MPAAETLEQSLAHHTREGELYSRLEDQSVRCVACGHRCLIREGRHGVCRVRFNRGGTLYVPFGYVGALQLDPVEKKPFFHAYPGSLALSFGMLGCDFKCPYCQNASTSQVLRDPDMVSAPQPITPAQLVLRARQNGARIITSTYNEPLITSEWAVAVFKEARAAGLVTSYVSNGNGTEEVLTYICPWVDLYKIDLKSFNDANYRRLGGALKIILETVERVYRMGFWLEVVTLTIPGFNDSDAELTSIAQFLASVSPDIPWHVTAFHKDYKMQEPDPTSAATLIRAARIGQAAGLRYVYAGNLPGQVGDFENTYCPECHALLIRRVGYQVDKPKIADGKCFQCKTPIPGRWGGL